jgi:ATP-dependent DNA helicase RecG
VNQSNELELRSLIEQGMGQDLHWFQEDAPISRLAAVLVGMANSLGGTVLLGVSPHSGELVGLRDVESAVDRIFQAALLVDPALVLPIPQCLPVRLSGRSSPCEILSVTVPGGLPNVYSLDGRYLGRQGVQTNPLSARSLRALLVERGAIQFESRIPRDDATLADLDPHQVEAYQQKVAASGLLPGNLTWEELLLRRGCLKRVDGTLQPTYAALLLFGRYPQQWLPNASILAGRFSGYTLADEYIKQDIAGTLPDQLRQAEAFVHSNLKSVVRMVGLTHQEAPEYPVEAVRELLVNAVAHRDYNLQGDNIHLFIFADRLEVQSPGGLPGPVTLNNLLDARFARNAVITQVLSDLGFVERLGYGLDRVIESLQKSRLPAPRFEDTAGIFRVTLQNHMGELHTTAAGAYQSVVDLSLYQNLNLNPRQQLALNYLSRYPRITSHQYQELCPDVHAETLRRDLVDLISQGILLKIGDKRATYYILKKLPGNSPR